MTDAYDMVCMSIKLFGARLTLPTKGTLKHVYVGKVGAPPKLRGLAWKWCGRNDVLFWYFDVRMRF